MTGFTRQALKARAKVRAGKATGYVELLREGERAAQQALPATACPYQGEDAEIWLEGFADGRQPAAAK